ncbi:MAG: hypothetical protein ACI8PQ_003373 [Planctomycetota bacterium]|jgi:hypothetical protein
MNPGSRADNGGPSNGGKPPAEEREPTRDQLLAMAYCDGELATDALEDFEARLEREPALLKEVSELKALEVIARAVAPREPGDYVRKRLADEPLQSGLTGLAFFCLIAAAVLGSGSCCWFLVTDDSLSVFGRLLCCLAVGGVVLLFLLTLRQRLLLIPHDPYRRVER